MDIVGAAQAESVVVHADIRGIRHYYEVSGTAGSPVLLIMGFGFSGKAWRPQVTALQAHHQVAWFDNRGVGQSGPALRRYGMADLALDAVGLLDHLGWTSAHVVGVSMGGMIAQEVALRHPERVRSLTLIATLAGGLLAKLPTARGLRLFVKAQTNKGAGRLAALDALLYPPGQRAEPGVIQPGFDQPPARRTIAWQLGAIVRHETRARLARLDRTPTLVIKPALDILVRPSHSDRLAAAIPGARLSVFAEGGHAVTVQCAARVNAELLTHFAAADAARVAAEAPAITPAAAAAPAPGVAHRPSDAPPTPHA